MNVRIPTPLRSYTAQAAVVSAAGATVDEVLVDLNRQFPGLRFRVVDEQGRLRTHMKVFVNKDLVRDLSTAVSAEDEVTLMQALSGG
ncbi:MAG: MoaD/ThiS family protein [Acidimicrobiales bacterium]